MRNSEKSAYIPENLCRFLEGGFVWKGGSLKHSAWSYLRTPVNNIEYFPPNFEELVLGCIDADFLQVNTRWKALAEIYTMHSFAPFSNLNFFVKNRQNFFAIEVMNIRLDFPEF